MRILNSYNENCALLYFTAADYFIYSKYTFKRANVYCSIANLLYD